MPTGFAIPIFLYSPLFTDFFKIVLPVPFGLNAKIFSFLLATPPILYSGWIFYVGAWRALQNRALNMAVLVALSVLAGYLFSIAATFVFESEVFYAVPALAQADVGIAIGVGTDVAMETADVVLMQSEPFDVVKAIQLSKATVSRMTQNLWWAAGCNTIAFPIAAGVFFPAFGLRLRPEIGAIAMSGSSLIVAVNALLLKYAKLTE